MTKIKNYEIIKALDNALTLVNSAILCCEKRSSKRVQGNAEVMRELKQERAALLETRKFIAEKRKD